MPTQDKIHELMFVDRHKVHVYIYKRIQYLYSNTCTIIIHLFTLPNFSFIPSKYKACDILSNTRADISIIL